MIEVIGTATPSEESDRRRCVDRRRRSPLLTDWRYTFRGRRRRHRRTADTHTTCLDWFPPRLLVVALGIFALSAVDAAVTLHLLGRGLVVEANPLMRPLLDWSLALFVHVKVFGTGLALMLLVLLSNLSLFGRIRLELAGWCLLGVYVGLVGYEAVLLSLARA